MSSIRSNIGKLYVLNVMLNAFTIVPVLVPFLESNGLSLHQIFLLQGVYSFSWVVADIPTGYLADIWGRKKTLITACVFFCLMAIGYTFGTDFWHFCACAMLLGIGVALTSGTIEALTYDTLLELGEEKTFRKVCGNQNITGWLGVAGAGILGGLIASYSFRMSAAAMLLFFVVGFFTALSLREPKRHGLIQKGHIGTMMRIFSDTLFRSPVLRSIILLFSLIGAMTFSLVWFTQPYQTLVHMPIYLFGIANAVFMVGMIAATKSAQYLEKRLDDRWLLVLFAVIALASFFALGLTVSVYGLLFLLIGRSTYGALNPLTADMINRLTTSDRRATVLSIRTFLYNLMFSFASPFLGYIAGAFTLNEAILITGIAGTVLALPILFLLRSVWHELPARV